MSKRRTLRIIIAAAATLALLVTTAGTAPANGDTIEWAKNTKLKWDDFTGAVPPTSNLSAYTSATIDAFGWECKDGKVVVTGGKAKFFKNESWKKEAKPGQKLLKHEHVHFDLAEVMSREFLAEAAKVGCDGTEEEIQKTLSDLYTKWTDMLQELNDLCDSQTNHGAQNTKAEKDAEKKWEKAVKGWLKDGFDEDDVK